MGADSFGNQLQAQQFEYSLQFFKVVNVVFLVTKRIQNHLSEQRSQIKTTVTFSKQTKTKRNDLQQLNSKTVKMLYVGFDYIIVKRKQY